MILYVENDLNQIKCHCEMFLLPKNATQFVWRSWEDMKVSHKEWIIQYLAQLIAEIVLGFYGFKRLRLPAQM